MDELNPQEEKNLKEAMRRSKMKEMLGSLKELESTLPEVAVDAPAKEVAKRRRIWPLVAAASVLLLLTVGWYLMQEEPMNAGERLFAENFEPYPPIGVTRGFVPTEKAKLKMDAYEAYSGSDYKSAVSLFGKLNTANTDTLSLFYMGISQIAIGNTEEGIETLNNFKKMSDELQEQADWYIVLGKLRLEELDEVEFNKLKLMKSN